MTMYLRVLEDIAAVWTSIDMAIAVFSDCQVDWLMSISRESWFRHFNYLLFVIDYLI